MELGTFSLSLAVEDIEVSKDFYEKLGFVEVGGDVEQGWLILRSGKTTFGLFQGMFPTNTLTFNPGWDSAGQETSDYTDVREIQKTLKTAGVELVSEVNEDSTGPASFMIVDPDGNPVLFDQHR